MNKKGNFWKIIAINIFLVVIVASQILIAWFMGSLADWSSTSNLQNLNRDIIDNSVFDTHN